MCSVHGISHAVYRGTSHKSVHMTASVSMGLRERIVVATCQIVCYVPAKHHTNVVPIEETIICERESTREKHNLHPVSMSMYHRTVTRPYINMTAAGLQQYSTVVVCHHHSSWLHTNRPSSSGNYVIQI